MALPQIKLPERVEAFVKACPALEHEVLTNYAKGLLHLSRSMELLARTEVSVKIYQLAVQVLFLLAQQTYRTILQMMSNVRSTAIGNN